MATTIVYIGVGSNIDKYKNIDGCLTDLSSHFKKIEISPIYQSKAIGMDAEDFYNLVVKFETNSTLERLKSKLREIEKRFGRERTHIQNNSRTLDIDLLLFGNLVSKKNNIPRDDITRYSFVLKPLYDLEPNLVHPASGVKVSTLWQKFDESKQPLFRVRCNFYSHRGNE